MKRTGFLTLLLILAGCDLFPPPGGSGPRVLSVTPAEGAANVSVGATVIAQLELPNGGVNVTTANDAAVRLVGSGTGEAVAASVFANNDAESLTLSPAGEREFGTLYRFEVTSGVVDENAQAFTEHSSTFTTVPEDVPSVIRSRPADGAVNVPVDAGISTDLNGVVDRTSVGDDSVYLVQVATGERVSGQPGYSGGDDTFNFVPGQPLTTNTTYRFYVTGAVRDTNGAAFVPYTATFTTGDDAGPAVPTGIVSVPQPTAAGDRHSSLTFGPDGNLYAATLDGRIKRYPVAADGALGTPTMISALQKAVRASSSA